MVGSTRMQHYPRRMRNNLGVTAEEIVGREPASPERLRVESARTRAPFGMERRNE